MKNLTADRLREVLSYDRETGQFVWLVSLSNKGAVGAVAGTLTKRIAHDGCTL